MKSIHVTDFSVIETIDNSLDQARQGGIHVVSSDAAFEVWKVL